LFYNCVEIERRQSFCSRACKRKLLQKVTLNIGVDKMSKKDAQKSVSIRVRLEQPLLERIDKVAGERNRQRFIHEAVEWKLNQELPPMFFELSEEITQLKARVEHLERSQATSVFLGNLNSVANEQICADDLDRKLLAFFLRNEGGTTPELAGHLLGDDRKRRTILDRIDRLNNRAIENIGAPILEYKKGFVKNKRGAWWLVDPSAILA
jgi:predicted DNA binding CopG/RHH family protein